MLSDYNALRHGKPNRRNSLPHPFYLSLFYKIHKTNPSHFIFDHLKWQNIWIAASEASCAAFTSFFVDQLAYSVVAHDNLQGYAGTLSWHVGYETGLGVYWF
jgi:hypothetical protein